MKSETTQGKGILESIMKVGVLRVTLKPRAYIYDDWMKFSPIFRFRNSYLGALWESSFLTKRFSPRSTIACYP
jgi:hypothetical protein